MVRKGEEAEILTSCMRSVALLSFKPTACRKRAGSACVGFAPPASPPSWAPGAAGASFMVGCGPSSRATLELCPGRAT